MNISFVAEQKSLLALLSAMQPICSKRTTLEATSCILFHVRPKELILKSTDLEISLQASCEIEEHDTLEPSSFLVSGRRIFELVKELDGMIKFTLTDKQLLLKAGSVHLALHIKDTEEFPPFPERIENLMHMSGAFLLGMINKVAFLIPQNNANPALNGLYLEVAGSEMKMTTTDGHCLAQITADGDFTIEKAHQWLLPRRAIAETKKLLEANPQMDVFVGICGNQLVFSGDTFNFFTRLLSSPFPKYDAVVDKEAFMPAKVSRSHFLKTLRRSACLLSGQFIATQFGFEESGLKVMMQNKEVGKLEEEVPLEGFEGARLDVRFYAPYLLSGLQVFSDDLLQFYLKNSAKPIMFESREDAYRLLYLVMPVANNA
jgi:DNA polymerase-3 subunit beta